MRRAELTARQIRQRLAQLPSDMLRKLEVVQLSRMTRKKKTCPCYGMQWGAALSRYPIDETLPEYFETAPTPLGFNEARGSSADGRVIVGLSDSGTVLNGDSEACRWGDGVPEALGGSALS